MNNFKAIYYYRSSLNFYHTIHHVEDLLEMWKLYRHYFLKEFPDLDEEKLITSIYWHDSVYEVGSEINEENSVKLYMKNGGNDNDVIETILSTKIGYKNFDTSLKKVMHDLDWSGFAFFKKFKANQEKIKNEIMILGKEKNEKLIISNQINFYKNYLNCDLFLTKTFSKFNLDVKNNIEKLINELENR